MNSISPKPSYRFSSSTTSRLSRRKPDYAIHETIKRPGFVRLRFELVSPRDGSLVRFVHWLPSAIGPAAIRSLRDVAMLAVEKGMIQSRAHWNMLCTELDKSLAEIARANGVPLPEEKETVYRRRKPAGDGGLHHLRRQCGRWSFRIHHRINGQYRHLYIQFPKEIQSIHALRTARDYALTAIDAGQIVSPSDWERLCADTIAVAHEANMSHLTLPKP